MQQNKTSVLINIEQERKEILNAYRGLMRSLKKQKQKGNQAY